GCAEKERHSLGTRSHAGRSRTRSEHACSEGGGLRVSVAEDFVRTPAYIGSINLFSKYARYSRATCPSLGGGGAETRWTISRPKVSRSTRLRFRRTRRRRSSRTRRPGFRPRTLR